jgi:hypothetical protein
MKQKKEVKSDFKKALQEVLDERQKNFKEKRRQSIYSIGESFNNIGNFFYSLWATLFIGLSFIFSSTALIVLTAHLGGTNFFFFNLATKVFIFLMVCVACCWFYGWLFKYLSKRGEVKK